MGRSQPTVSATQTSPMNSATGRSPSVAIAISVGHPEAKLLRSVLSVLWQLKPADELFVVSDRPGELPDCSRLRKFGRRITWIERAGHGAGGDARIVLRQAKADWLKPLDADDVLAPFALELLRRANPPLPGDIQVFLGGHFLIQNDRYAGRVGLSKRQLASGLARNDLPASATFIRRRALKQLPADVFQEGRWAVWHPLRDRFGPGCFALTSAPVCYCSPQRGHRIGRAGRGPAPVRSASTGLPLQKMRSPRRLVRVQAS